jgi:Gpi18-like mannosyltransferase
VFIALFAIVSDRFALGNVSLAIAVLIKPQPVIFVPLILVYLWRWARREQFVTFTVAGAVTALIFLLPILVPHFQRFDMFGNTQAES